jgi:RHS repeat-associated protein
LGSSSVVVDSTGGLINREEYLPYGETSFGSFTRKRYRFTGKERDAESGLCYHGARYYAPWLARWLTCDPMPSGVTSNLYQYASDNPSNLVDLSGQQEGSPRKAETPSNPISAEQLHNARAEFLKGIAAAVGQDRWAAVKEWLFSPLGPLSGLGGFVGSLAKALDIEPPDFDVSFGDYDRGDKGTAGWNPLESGLKEFSIADQLTGQGLNLLAQGNEKGAYKSFGDAGYRYGRFVLNMYRMSEMAVGGAAVVKSVGSLLSNARTYITYVFRDLQSEVRYVGRAAGEGDPLKVLWDRIAKGHDVAKEHPWLQPEVIDVQRSRLASQGAEGYYHQQFRKIAQEKGLPFFNSPKSPPLGSSSAEKLTNSLKKLTRFIMGRGTD